MLPRPLTTDIRGDSITSSTRIGFSVHTAVAHLIVNGELAAQLLFGGIAILAFGGTLAIDAKRRVRDPAGFARLAAQTSNIPMAALIAGRTRLYFGDIGWWRLLLAERYRGSEILYS